MFQLLDLGRDDVLAYRASDIVTDDDMRAATAAFDAVLNRHDTVHLYAEVEGLRGFDARALWLDLVYGLRHLGALRHIGRVALVTDSDWIRRIARIEARILPIGRLHTYRPDDRDTARAWIGSAPTVAADAPSPRDDMEGWLAAGGLDAAWDLEDWLDDEWADDEGPDEARARRPRAPRFGHTVHRTHVLLRDVAGRLGVDGTAPAYHALRAVLPALRDRIPDAEAADLAAQLTMLVRGMFYEGYHPGRSPRKDDRDAFLDTVSDSLRLGTPFSAEAAVAAVGGALGDSVSEGEWTQVLSAMPADVRALFETPIAA
ncbi:DUF2267 domain-containing protein [Rubrivirga sp. IMCC43871]|uniref:DUF2267 domain-containing protein n=1 Tax=Rubrivirga sp. IMCC43871 TaxID=3391575 RepID=UPI003990366B